MNYLDFDIDLRVHDALHYQVTARAAVGETNAVVAFPLTDAQLENHLLRLENAILRSVGRRRIPQSEEERVIQAFGRQLFDFLLSGDVRALYYESLREAARQQQGVRLRLHIHAPALALLPWEFLYDPRRSDYVCLDPYTPLVRYLDLPQAVQPLSVAPPLRILGMVASPGDLPPLDVAVEQANLERALQGLIAQGLVELTWLAGQTWRDLQRAMRSTAGPWHIVHFIGHGGFDATRGEGVLYLADEQGRSRPIGATQLSRLFAGQRYALRLVVLNACEGARGGRADILSSTAATLVRGGLPAVLAMQYDITDLAAVELAQSFYEAIADGLPVDTAVAEARNALSLANEQSLEWGTPVLYLRSADGHLFAIDDTARVDSARVGTEPVTSTPPSLPALTEQRPPSTPTATRHREPNPVQTETAKAATQLSAQTNKLPIAFDWVTIPAGEFLMGEDDKQHLLTLPEYQIARVPVTNAQYKQFVEATKHSTPEHWKDGRIPEGKEEHPVVYVSWHDAIAFCKWAGVRLPTEAEWEKAAAWDVDRQTKRVYPWGDESPTDKLCNFGFNKGDTTPVGAYPEGRSPYGLLDMAGNVWEWTSSLYQSYPYKADDGREDLAADGRRTLRGGSWLGNEDGVRCAVRSLNLPDSEDYDLGFRVVVSSPGF